MNIYLKPMTLVITIIIIIYIIDIQFQQQLYDINILYSILIHVSHVYTLTA